jgi:hypothetical protein
MLQSEEDSPLQSAVPLQVPDGPSQVQPKWAVHETSFPM